jgi:hypothetical protein
MYPVKIGCWGEEITIRNATHETPSFLLSPPSMKQHHQASNLTAANNHQPLHADNSPG